MLQKTLFLLFVLFPTLIFAQVRPRNNQGTRSPISESTSNSQRPEIVVKDTVATIDQYRIITLNRDTTYVDTSLTIQKEYKFNYLRRDLFGLQPFANEGHPYNILDFGLVNHPAYPDFGYKAKHYNFMQAGQINYYSVATPLTELYFKSVMEQGQTLDAFLTLNTTPNLNFSVAYKGHRSLGKYINQLSSAGNFRFTTSYNTKNRRYFANFHFVAQDMLNGENGGIVDNQDFESDDAEFNDRSRLEVYLTDATSFLKGTRLFLDHAFRINPSDAANNIFIGHQFKYDYESFEYKQPTVSSTITADNGTTSFLNRFGDSYLQNNIHDKVRYNRMHNIAKLTYQNKTLGQVHFFADDFRYNYYYNKVLFLTDQTVPDALEDQINSIGGGYDYRKEKWRGNISYATAIAGSSYSDLSISASYQLNERNQFYAKYYNRTSIPDHIYNLHQSDLVAYNWFNNFKNEKVNALEVTAETQFVNASLQVKTINDHLYFSDISDNDLQQIIAPTQYSETIGYLSLKVSREFKFRNFALDNTLLYQQTEQPDPILNVPKFVTRNTIYYSNHFFKRALFLQTGVTFNYFTKYYANAHNPVVGEFFVQNSEQIGNFPMLDFFINARVRQTRIFFKAEHFNSPFTGNKFYSAPDQPYRDFLIRFGLVWNFFK
ncbi:MAG: putative porin [Flavobacterium sp.]|nr:putative porin [Flavobacterium sp.]